MTSNRSGVARLTQASSATESRIPQCVHALRERASVRCGLGSARRALAVFSSTQEGFRRLTRERAKLANQV